MPANGQENKNGVWYFKQKKETKVLEKKTNKDFLTSSLMPTIVSQEKNLTIKKLSLPQKKSATSKTKNPSAETTIQVSATPVIPKQSMTTKPKSISKTSKEKPENATKATVATQNTGLATQPKTDKAITSPAIPKKNPLEEEIQGMKFTNSVPPEISSRAGENTGVINTTKTMGI